MTLLECTKYVLKSGIQPGQSFSEKKEIIFVNKVALSLCLLGLTITTSELIVGYSVQGLIAFSISALSPLVFLLQKKGRYLLAKVAVWAIPTAAALTAMTLYGAAEDLHFYLIALLCISLIFFKSKPVKAFMFIFHVGLFIGIESLGEQYEPIIVEEASTLLKLLNIVFMLFMLWLLLYEFQNHQVEYDSKIKSLMESITGHAELLEKQKRQIEEQALSLQLSNQILQKEAVEKEAAKQQILASNEELKQYAYVASHDLKEPLRTVASFTQLIQRKHQNDFDDTSQEYFNFVVDAVTRMSRMLDDLLVMSRLNQKFKRQEVSFNDVLAEVKHNLRHQLESVKGKLDVSPLPNVPVNRQQFVQLFQNLISNGLKFKSNDAPVVLVRHKESEQEHLFFIKDNGIGIPAEFQEKIFVLFQRLHGRNEYEGSGIGLSICRKVVKNHGGRIWLEPEKGQGATFAFSLPKNGKPMKFSGPKKFEIGRPKPATSPPLSTTVPSR